MKENKMKILVTGGAGFIGSHLVDRLLQEGNEVTVYDDLSNGTIENSVRHEDDEKYQFVLGSVSSRKPDTILIEAMTGNDIVYHLAANSDAGAGNNDTKVDFNNGTLATFNVLDAMRITGIKKIVFTSSSVVYGNAEPPTPENTVLQPISLYGASKMAAEAQIVAYCAMFGMQAWIFRFANIVGSRAGHGIIHDLILKIKSDPNNVHVLGNGTQSKSYLHVSECIDAVQYAVKHSNNQINIFNVGSKDQCTVKNISEMIVEEFLSYRLLMNSLSHNNKNKICLSYDSEDKDRGWNGDVPKFLLATDKINNLGWSAKMNSEESIRLAIKEMIRELW